MSEPTTSTKIITFLKVNPGSKARDIAKAIGIDKTEVNKFLYGQLRDQCKQDSAYNWFVKGDEKTKESVSTPASVDTPLSRLCNYYLSCIAEDSGAKVSVFAQSKHDLDYKELESLPTSFEDVSDFYKSSEVQSFLGVAKRDKSKNLYFGYPVALSHAHSNKSDWEGYFVNPVFLFPIKIQEDGNEISIDFNFPTINRAVFERFTNAKGEELVRELVTLEEELGISGEGEQLELDELVQRLRSLRPEWQWIEETDPSNLSKSPSLQECTTEGILNRAVILKIQEPVNKFTQGLEYELNQLAKLSEQDYKDTALGQWIHRTIQSGARRI
jgi:hypothetical protein